MSAGTWDFKPANIAVEKVVDSTDQVRVVPALRLAILEDDEQALSSGPTNIKTQQNALQRQTPSHRNCTASACLAKNCLVQKFQAI